MIAGIVLAFELARFALAGAARAALEAGSVAHARALDTSAAPARFAAYQAAYAAYDAAARASWVAEDRNRARFGAGVVLAEGLGRHADALVVFEGLLAQDALDRPVAGKPSGNQRHHAWRMVSTCQLALGHHALALEATLAMREAFVPQCSCCHAGLARLVRRRLHEIACAWLDTAARPIDDAALRALAGELDQEPTDEILWALGRFAAERGLPARGPLERLVVHYAASRRVARAQALLATLGAKGFDDRE